MKKTGLILGSIFLFLVASGQDVKESSKVFKISEEDLAGENLTPGVQNGESDTSYYQQRVYDGTDFIIFLVAINNRTNEFGRFPLEEFILWADGKAIVEPDGEEPFEIQAGDYFIQPKGFKGKFNFVSGDEPHLELSLISKKRADSALVSPMTKAMIIDPDILSGSSEQYAGEISTIYSGVEIEVNLVRTEKRIFQGNQKETLIHLLSGILLIDDQRFYPGDFLVIPEDFVGEWESVGFRPFRALEVYQVDFD